MSFPTGVSLNGQQLVGPFEEEVYEELRDHLFGHHDQDIREYYRLFFEYKTDAKREGSAIAGAHE